MELIEPSKTNDVTALQLVARNSGAKEAECWDNLLIGVFNGVLKRIAKYLPSGLRTKLYPFYYFLYFWYYRFRFVRPEHFESGLSRDRAKTLFKKSVFLVAIEPFSYCNRRCWFCPNSFIDRHSTNHKMAPPVYQKILADLREIDYGGEIGFASYCEPLADRIILEFLRQARQACPKALLHINTNGDYLSQSYVSELYEAGLRSLVISAYPSNDNDYDDAVAETMCQKMLKHYALPFALTFRRPGEGLEYQLTYRDMEIRLCAPNYAQTGLDRGGLLSSLQRRERTFPCLDPFRYLRIEHNGVAMPCCNLRSDNRDHVGCALADLTDEHPGLFDAYTSEAAVAWRKSLIKFGRKEPPCNACLKQ